jgi:hypothetical protein
MVEDAKEANLVGKHAKPARRLARECATVLVCHLAGKSALRPFRTWSDAVAERIGSD